MVKRVGEMDSYAVNYGGRTLPGATAGRSAWFRTGPTIGHRRHVGRPVSAILDEVAPADLDAAEQAWRIQAWLRSARFTYCSTSPHPWPSTTRVERCRRPAQPIPRDSTRLLCSSPAMVMMARHRGIPARVAIGSARHFNGREWTILRSADAHAWPESTSRRSDGCASNPPRAILLRSGTRLDDRRRALTRGLRPRRVRRQRAATAAEAKRQRRARAHHLGRAGAGRGVADVGGWLRATWIPLTTILLVAISVDHAPPGLDSAASRSGAPS